MGAGTCGLLCSAYLPSCILLPYVFKTTPPKVQIVGSFFFIGCAFGFMGPSALLGLPENIYILAFGTVMSGGTVAPLFV